MNQFCRIHVQPDNVQLDIALGRTLLFGLADHGIFLRSNCGGKGTCNKCRVTVKTTGHDSSHVQACSFSVTGDLAVHLPDITRLPSCILDKAPLLLPESFSQACPGGPVSSGYGVAIDLGTTTIGCYLCHIGERRVLASLALKNPQAIYGDDVMTRISAIVAAGGDTEGLQRPVLYLIEQALHRLCTAGGIDTAELTDLVASGNPTMIHIFLGENPETIGVSPYLPIFTEARQTDAAILDISSFSGRVRTLPLVSGFIGADTLAAALAVGIMSQPVGTLLVDLGTNGELVLVGERGVYATSCATGPAFEGASLSCGMQAGNGAIDRVEIDAPHARPRYQIIGEHSSSNGSYKPLGLCGSGVVSAVAACLRTGIIADSGAFYRSGEIPFLSRDGQNHLGYHVVGADDSGTGSAILLSQKDIRAVQLGKAALRAGIDQLLATAGLAEPVKILLAGAFGSHIRPRDMIRLGMLPDIDESLIHSVGNAAGAGTVMALCDPESFAVVEALAASIITINLADNAEFQKVFTDCLRFSARGADKLVERK